VSTISGQQRVRNSLLCHGVVLLNYVCALAHDGLAGLAWAL